MAAAVGLALAGAALAATGRAAAASLPYTAVHLGQFSPNGLNDHGDVAGHRAGRPVVWRDGVLTPLPTAGFPFGEATDINNRGVVVGFVFSTDASDARAARWTLGGGPPELAPARLGRSSPRGVNELGHASGTFESPEGVRRAFFWGDGAPRAIGTLGHASSRGGGINDLDHVAATAQALTGEQHAFLWQAGTIVDLSVPSEALDVNNSDQVVGRGFLWDDGITRPLEVPPGGSPPSGFEINNAGTITGTWIDDNGNVIDGVWQDGRFLGELCCYAFLNDLNERGQIVTQDNDLVDAFLLTPVTCAGRFATVVGTAAAEDLTGTPEADVIVGRAGNDAIHALDGDDRVCAGRGHDVVDGGAGDDRLRGRGGADTLLGAVGADALYGGLGDDRLQAGSGDDLISGGSGDDVLDGGAGTDRCGGGAGVDEATACERLRLIP